MRDLASYEANACDYIEFNSKFSQAYENVTKCLKKIKGHTDETSKFSERLNLNVENGVRYVQDLWVQMRFSNQLI